VGSAEIYLVLAIALAGYAVFNFVLVLVHNNTDREVLSWASGNEPQKSKSGLINLSRPLVHQFTLQHAVKVKSQSYRKKIEKLILTAGLSRELNVDEFIGLQIFWGIAFPGFMALMNFALEAEISPLLLLAMVPLGWKFPEIYASREKRNRQASIRTDLPFFADILALSTEAGLDFIGALQRIVDKAQNSALAEEFGIVLKDIKLGSARADALRALAARCDTAEVTSFVAVLIDADATGASVSKVLKDQSEQIRLERFVRAEKAGARAAQLMLFPIIFFIIPAVFIVVMGPIAVNMITGGFNQ
jgi:tight adherence protein C